MIGKILGNRYEILERIGGGGMALVYRATDSFLHRTVAVKVLRSQFAGDSDFVRRFRREAQAAASLSHPNIVAIYDVGQQGDIYYIVMEYISGETLKQRIDRKGPLPVVEALAITAQIADALDAAHQSGVIHRDIKPHNILLTKGDRVKVTDFGIARAATGATLTVAGTIMGSVHYFSPEQARGESTGARSDIYSLGAVLYEALTGKVPFEGDSPISVAMKHIEGRVVPPRELRSDIPVQVQAIVMKAMEKDPSRRYESAADMLADLNRALSDLLKEERSRAEGSARNQTARFDRDESWDTEEENGEMSRDDGRPRRGIWRRLLVLFLVVTFLSALGSYAYFMLQRWLDVPLVEVPDVRGMSILDAQNTLKESGLDWIVVAQIHDSTVPANHVIDQSPPPGQEAKQGRDVELTLSKGPKMVPGGVPQVVGLHRQAAEIELNAVGLQVGAVKTAYSEEYEKDYVIEQNPKAGTAVAEGTLVDITLSLGPEPKLVSVPDLRGSSLQDAKSLIEELGLKVGRVTQRDSNQLPGTVIDQTPAPETEVLEGTEINLVISEGSGEDISQRNVVVTVPEDLTDEPHKIMLRVTDSKGMRVEYEGMHRPGEQFTVTVRWLGEVARLTIFIDGKAYEDVILRR